MPRVVRSMLTPAVRGLRADTFASLSAMSLAAGFGLYAAPPSSSKSGGIVKLLLTSGGVTNASIRDALVKMLGRPIEASSALCIPTAMYGHPSNGPGERAWRFISGQQPGNPMVDLGWMSTGVLELTALPSIDEELWVPLVRRTDVLLVAGGDVLYLCHWMRESGLADLLPSLDDTVWVGLSAGSMVMTPEVGEDFIQWRPPSGDDSTLGLVDFSICPHVAPDGRPGNTMAEAEHWAAGISGPAYAIDDQTAIKAADGTIEVVSEGHWKQLN
jgi:dipeptidase E